MLFEFDEAKSASNLIKHGIDFIEAQSLWSDGDLLIVPAKDLDELRFVAIGMIGFKHWSAVFTLRGESIRIISVRRSRDKEVEAYEGI